MEKFEIEPKINPEAEPQFHFEEIAGIESSVLSLVQQLKETIDAQEYDTLISDDIGGRIVTLVLRKIIKTLHPDQPLKTYFIASGQKYLPTPAPKDKENYDKLQEHLETIADKTTKALIVTEFIFSGNVLIYLTDAIKDSGINNFDFAVLDSALYPKEKEEKFRRNKHKLYIGGTEWHLQNHPNFTGIGKLNQYLPFPKKLSKVIAEDGRDISVEEQQEIFEIDPFEPTIVKQNKLKNPERIAELEKRKRIPLTSEEIAEIQQNINFAREDVELLASRIIAQVWGKKSQ